MVPTGLDRTQDQTASTLDSHLLRVCVIALGLCANLAASTVQMTFVGVNGAQSFGYYVGPYAGVMNDAPVDLFCVDFANEVTFGQVWIANLTPITSGADLSDSRYGSYPGSLALYQEAAWLTLQYESQPANQFGDIQATIWQLFNATAPTPGSGWWLEQACRNYSSVDYADFRIVTNLGPVLPYGQVQEFLVRAESSAIPEPGTQLLVGLTLVGAACTCRRRRRIGASK